MSEPLPPTAVDLGTSHDLDPRFTFSFQALTDPDDASQRWSTWNSVEPSCRGPEPRPDWLVTSQGALDTDLGILKSGKEADVFLVRRADEGSDGVVMAAKRYRDEQHRSFRRAATYAEGRRVRDTRATRAMAKKSRHGREVAAGQWAWAEWQALVRLWELKVSVPYPVQIDGTEVLMEWITAGDQTAPRLAQTRPSAQLLASYFDQARDAIIIMLRAGLVHGDLSAYNILAAGDRLVFIDLPQVIDWVANPQGMEFLLRDATNLARWFTARGHHVDEQEFYADLVAHGV